MGATPPAGLGQQHHGPDPQHRWPDSRHRVPALRRGLEVLRLLAARPGPISAAAIARDLGLARSTVYELLTELCAAGFAVHLAQQRRFGLGPVAFEIGSAYLRSQPLEHLARPLLAKLADTTGGTAHLGILHGAETLYLARDRPTHAPSLVSQVGVRLPAALTATGLAMLTALPAAQVRALYPSAASFVLRNQRGVRSFTALRERLHRVRARGWAVEDGEVSEGAASLAAPVFDHNSRPIAAIGLTIAHSCPAPPNDPAGCGTDLTEFSTVVRSAADSLTRAISGSSGRMTSAGDEGAHGVGGHGVGAHGVKVAMADGADGRFPAGALTDPDRARTAAGTA